MRNRLFLGIAAVLAATLPALGTADLTASGVADFPPPAMADPSVAGTTDPAAFGTPGLSAVETAEAKRRTCFGRPATLVGTTDDDVIVGTPRRT